MEPKENQNLWIQILRAVETKVDPNSFETWFDGPEELNPMVLIFFRLHGCC